MSGRRRATSPSHRNDSVQEARRQSDYAIAFQTERDKQMASLGKAKFKSKSGNRYRFKVFPLNTRFRKISGIYLIACRHHSSQGGHRHKILYVGNTEDISQPFEKHRKAQDLMRLGANCICVQSDESEESRLGKERRPDCRIQSCVQRLTAAVFRFYDCWLRSSLTERFGVKGSRSLLCFSFFYEGVALCRKGRSRS